MGEFTTEQKRATLDHASEPAHAASAPANQGLLQQGMTLLDRMLGNTHQAPPEQAKSIRDLMAAMKPDILMLPDPGVHDADFSNPLRAELSRARQLYTEALGALAADGHGQNDALLAQKLANLLRALHRVHAEGTEYEGVVGRLRPVAEQAYRLIANPTR